METRQRNPSFGLTTYQRAYHEWDSHSPLEML